MPKNSDIKHQKLSFEESDSLTYTEYKAKLGVVDEPEGKTKHNNYIKEASVAEEKADESNATIAYNVNESVHIEESSADFA